MLELIIDGVVCAVAVAGGTALNMGLNRLGKNSIEKKMAAEKDKFASEEAYMVAYNNEAKKVKTWVTLGQCTTSALLGAGAGYVIHDIVPGFLPEETETESGDVDTDTTEETPAE